MRVKCQARPRGHFLHVVGPLAVRSSNAPLFPHATGVQADLLQAILSASAPERSGLRIVTAQRHRRLAENREAHRCCPVLTDALSRLEEDHVRESCSMYQPGTMRSKARRKQSWSVDLRNPGKRGIKDALALSTHSIYFIPLLFEE